MSDDELATSGAEPPMFRWGAVSDVGRVRDVNQDSMLVRDGLFVVADGMGGHRGGEVASAVAVETLREVPDDVTVETLVDHVRSANTAVYERGASDESLTGMGTTLCAVALVRPDPETEGDDPYPDGLDHPPTLGIVNVGDSRVYLFSEGRLAQVTHDHSLVASMVRDGRLTAVEAAAHPQRNVVTRALGIQPDVLVDHWTLPARTGDRYVLASDGLFDEVTELQIAAVLRRLADPEEAASELVRLANENGARDNVTVVVVDVVAGVSGEPVVVPSQPSVAGPADVRADASGDTSGHAGSLLEPPDDLSPRISRSKTAAFVVAVLAVLAIGLFLVGRYARDNYFVTFDTPSGTGSVTDQIVIFQGRPDGVLWFDPTVEERTPLLGLDLNDALVLELEQIPEFDTLEDARRYVVELTTRAGAD